MESNLRTIAQLNKSKREKTYLMTTAYQFQVMHSQKSGYNISTKRKTYATIVFAPILVIKWDRIKRHIFENAFEIL